MRLMTRSCESMELLVKQAVSLAKTVYGDSHPKYADCLVDYG